MQNIRHEEQVGRFLLEMQARIDHYALQQRSDEVKRGMKSRILQGYLPARAPLGYEQTGMRGLYRPTDLALRIGAILGDFADNKTTLQEAKISVKALVKKETGIAMDGLRTFKLMSNPYYAGCLSLNGKAYQGKHTAVISFEQHESIVNKLPTRFRMRKFYSTQITRKARG
jgi:site-specific DNA recombinase